MYDLPLKFQNERNENQHRFIVKLLGENLLFCVPDALNLGNRLFSRISGHIDKVSGFDYTIANDVILFIIVVAIINTDW